MKIPTFSRRTRLSSATIAVTTFLVSLGALPAVALWEASSTATGTVNVPKVEVSQSGFTGLTATYLNSALSSTGSFTIKNTGGAAGVAGAVVTATGTLAEAMSVQAWPVANTAVCTTATDAPETAVMGTWANFPALEPIQLDPAATITVCVRTTIADRNGLFVIEGVGVLRGVVP